MCASTGDIAPREGLLYSCAACYCFVRNTLYVSVLTYIVSKLRYVTGLLIFETSVQCAESSRCVATRTAAGSRRACMTLHTTRNTARRYHSHHQQLVTAIVPRAADYHKRVENTVKDQKSCRSDEVANLEQQKEFISVFSYYLTSLYLQTNERLRPSRKFYQPVLRAFIE
ncbi:hypothetical protein O3G_MSEX012930 [Manduca sexta]|uniref:Uncharacterized protein n=1 Tax=Manduca sexta TaxID=7130 RepID=A0A922CXU1_MANSE|nr:hypothetical protein O3G_MSEX012930 [Manduca sexta]